MYKLSFKNSSNRYSIQDLFDNIQRVWDSKKSQPTINDMGCCPSEIHFGTYFNRFGSWKKALHDFVKYKNGGMLLKEKHSTNKRRTRTLNAATRFDIMKRDNFKCRLCGKSPATHNSIVLEIDHVIPKSRGGDNNPKNLQTLCSKCNCGKSNKF
jgi:hypothetical protein